MTALLICLWLRFEHFVILPLRWYRSHIQSWREMSQRCKVCGQTTGFCFQATDEIWAAVVPPYFRTRVVCLRCFDRFAKEKGVDYSNSLSEMLFAGDKACFGLDVTRSVESGD